MLSNPEYYISYAWSQAEIGLNGQDQLVLALRGNMGNPVWEGDEFRFFGDDIPLLRDDPRIVGLTLDSQGSEIVIRWSSGRATALFLSYGTGYPLVLPPFIIDQQPVSAILEWGNKWRWSNTPPNGWVYAQ